MCEIESSVLSGSSFSSIIRLCRDRTGGVHKEKIDGNSFVHVIRKRDPVFHEYGKRKMFLGGIALLKELVISRKEVQRINIHDEFTNKIYFS